MVHQFAEADRQDTQVHLLDSGLLATVRGLTFDRVKADRGTFGALLESFVFSEVLKLMTASDLRLTPHHFRDRDMREVDIVLERDDGTIVGIEVKASATVKAGDFGGLRALAEACGDRFAFGVVLYDSTDVVPFGGRLAAAPLSCLGGRAPWVSTQMHANEEPIGTRVRFRSAITSRWGSCASRATHQRGQPEW